MNDNCVRARSWLAQWADGELAPEQRLWMESHWEQCPLCRAERDGFRAIGERLLSFGKKIETPAEPRDRARFVAGIDQLECQRGKRLGLIPAAAALFAAASALTIWLSRPPTPPGPGADKNGFVAVPYVPPIAAYERSSVVSMQMPVADLLADGYSIAADPSEVVQADVLLGEDGRVHAVRLASNQILKGIGD
jgi:hypothetical protein